MENNVILWSVKGWVLPVMAITILIVPTYLLGYIWLAIVFAGFAIILGAIELTAIYKTGKTVSSNTAIKIKRNPFTIVVVVLIYLVFSIILGIHLWAIAFY